MLLLVIGSIIISTNSQSATVIKDYLRVNNLKTVLFVSCVDQTNFDLIETISTLQHQEIWTNVWDFSKSSLLEADYERFFIRLSNTDCVVVDLDYNETIPLMKEFSNRILFHYERNWLIFSSHFNKSFDILSQQNINVDADVSLAIPVVSPEKNNHNYDIYEVYNPSSQHGCRLNVTRMGYWSQSTGLHLLFKQTKIERRRNLQGITFTSVITVSERAM